MWINIVASVLSGLTGAAALLTNIFGQGEGQKIIAAISLAGIIVGSVNAALHGTSTSAPGPLGK
jgi:hypothetical protein